MGRRGRSFVGDEGGNAAILLAVMSIPLMVLAGGSLDLMGQERERARAQAALDAGLIAASGLNEARAPETIIREYFRAANLREDEYTFTVSETRTINAHKVSAAVTRNLPTAFLRLARLDTLKVKVTGGAEEAMKNLEMSLVLDMSGSMKGSRIEALKPAAKSFVDQLLTSKTKSYTSISLVPFGGQTNIGKTMFDVVTGPGYKKRQDLSHAFDFRETTFTDTIPNFGQFAQMQYFGTQGKTQTVGYEWVQTPTSETSITYLSNEADRLKSRIDGMKMYDGTGTQTAMRWAYHLLDPAFKPSLKEGRGSDPTLYPAAFADRPSAFDDAATAKFIVLMTDGQIWEQVRPTDTKTDVFQQGDSGPATKSVLSFAQVKSLFSEVCTAAKAKGITIFTIGFETDSSMRPVLSGCASSPTKFYEASTSSLAKVFDEIAKTIAPLRLSN